jgi:hypothetical protein
LKKLCPFCDQLFHEMCMGYADGTVFADIIVPDGVELKTEVYCTNCIFDKELKRLLRSQSVDF